MLTIVLSGVTWLVNFIRKHHRAFIIGLAIVILLLVVMFTYRACKPQATINEKEIFEAQTAIAERDDKKLREILANVEVREKAVDNAVQNSANVTQEKIVEAKKKYDNMNASELQAEFERRARESK